MGAGILLAVLAASGALVWRLETLNARAEEHNTMTGPAGRHDQEVRERG